jgi:Na+/proline symporter
VQERGDRIFPLFILQRMPVGLVGLLIAGIFAAAISSLDSILAALSQTVISAFYKPWREKRRPEGNAAGAGDKHYVRVSKVFVVLAGVLLCGMAQVSKYAYDHYENILNLALAMASYTYGAILAAFILAFFRRFNRDAHGLLWATPLSVLSVFAITWHQDWAQIVTIAASVVLLAGWLYQRAGDWRRGDAWRCAAMLIGCQVPIVLCCYAFKSGGRNMHLTQAWPWNVPLGFVVALVWGIVLAYPRKVSATTPEAAQPAASK